MGACSRTYAEPWVVEAAHHFSENRSKTTEWRVVAPNWHRPKYGPGSCVGRGENPPRNTVPRCSPANSWRWETSTCPSAPRAPRSRSPHQAGPRSARTLDTGWFRHQQRHAIRSGGLPARDNQGPLHRQEGGLRLRRRAFPGPVGGRCERQELQDLRALLHVGPPSDVGATIGLANNPSA